MKKRFYTIDDLYNYLCVKGKNLKFSSKDNTVLMVHALGETTIDDFNRKNQKFESDEDDEDDRNKGLIPVTIKVCHIGLNRNKSYISEEAMKKNMDTLKNRPILANVIQLDDGGHDFHAHDIEMNEDNGSLEYIERPIGIIPESNDAHLEYDQEYDKTYLVSKGFLYETYAEKAKDILEEKGGKTKVSVEIAITDMSFNAKKKYLEIKEFYFDGVTCLGSEADGEEIEEGMLGSQLTLDDFSSTEEVTYSKEEMDKLLEAVNWFYNTQVSNSYKGLKKANYNSKEGGTYDSMTKFEELCEKYGISAEDVDFEHEDMTDEELEAAFDEHFKKDTSSEEDEAKKKKCDEDSSEASEDEACGTGKKKKCDEDSKEDEACGTGKKKKDEEDPSEDEACGTGKKKKNEEDSEDEACGTGKKKKQCSLEGNTLKFEISLEDKMQSLYMLLRDTGGDDNDCYYPVATYDSYFIYKGCDSGKYYKQGYTVNDSEVTFVGDRSEVFVHYLTSDEESRLTSMNQNYDALVKFKNETEKVEKESILNSEAYSSIHELEEFAALVKDEDKYTISEIINKADAILGKFERRSKKSSNTGAINHFTYRKVASSVDTSKESEKPYGGLFEEFQIKTKR